MPELTYYLLPSEAAKELPGQNCGRPGSISKDDSRVPLASVKKRALLTLALGGVQAPACCVPLKKSTVARLQGPLSGAKPGEGLQPEQASATSRGQQGARVDPK